MPSRLSNKDLGKDAYGENPMLLIRPQVRKFIEHFVKHGNVTAAEEHAGVKPNCGWWYKKLENAMVAHALRHYREAWSRKFEHKDFEIANEIDRIAMKPDQDLDGKYTPRDKIQALRLAAQAKNLLKQEIKITGQVTIDHQISAAWERRKAKAIDVQVTEVKSDE